MRMNRLIGLLSRLSYLFKNGNEYSAVTGGWGRYAWAYNTATDSGGAPSGSNDGTSLSVSLGNLYNSGISGVIRTGNMIDLTNVGTIRLRIAGTLGACATSKGGYQEVYIFTRQSADGNWISGNTAQALVMSHQSGASVAVDAYVGLNVAALYGAHYICIGVRWKQQNEPTVLWIQDINREAP